MKCDHLLGRMFDGEVYILASDVMKAVAELKQKLEDVQASMYCDVVDANMENRRLRRALWIARAWRAKERQRMLPNNKEFYTWQEVERRCSKKAEEYK